MGHLRSSASRDVQWSCLSTRDAHLHPFPFPPPPTLPFSPSILFHIPPLVTTPVMYRWIGSRLSPRSESAPAAVPPPLPPVHCQRCHRTFRDHRAYHEHRQTSDLHHLCQRCGNDHETHRALQVVSESPFTSQSHFKSMALELN